MPLKSRYLDKILFAIDASISQKKQAAKAGWNVNGSVLSGSVCVALMDVCAWVMCFKGNACSYVTWRNERWCHQCQICARARCNANRLTAWGWCHMSEVKGLTLILLQTLAASLYVPHLIWWLREHLLNAWSPSPAPTNKYC